jgi:hypothetical protein
MKVESNAPGVQLYTGNWLGKAEKAEPHRALPSASLAFATALASMHLAANSSTSLSLILTQPQ